jgi:hypothetical protein
MPGCNSLWRALPVADGTPEISEVDRAPVSYRDLTRHARHHAASAQTEIFTTNAPSRLFTHHVKRMVSRGILVETTPGLFAQPHP